jgi:hypothetical protein
MTFNMELPCGIFCEAWVKHIDQTRAGLEYTGRAQNIIHSVGNLDLLLSEIFGIDSFVN